MVVQRVSLKSIQPNGEDLPSPEDVISRLERLEIGGRARVGIAGCSFEGRLIPYIALSSSENMKKLDSVRRQFQRASTPSICHETLQRIHVTRCETGTSGDLPIPILLTGGSFAFEASLTEALLQVAEQLATTDDEITEEILRSLVVLIMPMTNPDGTVRANAEWMLTPKSCGWEGSGNSFGLLQNRDFMNLSQPETQAIATMWQDWCPVIHYDPQEDIVMLGVTREEVCWCPPYRLGTYPASLSPVLKQWIDRLGQEIAESWRAQGGKVLYDPSGEEGFLPVVGDLGARCAVTAVFHDIIGIETESARTPGTQTWEDRNRQKVLAARAILAAACREKDTLLDQLLALRNDINIDCKQAYIIPYHQRNRGMMNALLEVIRRYGILVYSVASPSKAFIVPLSQPRPNLIRFLLSDWPGMPQGCLAPEYGIDIIRLSELPKTDQQRFLTSALQPYETLPRGCICITRECRCPDKDATYAFTPTVHNTRLIMRLLSQVQVRRTLSPEGSPSCPLPAGTYFLKGIPEAVIRRAAQGYGHSPLDVDASLLSTEPRGESVTITLPRVGLYTGPGCNLDYSEYSGAIRAALEYLEIPFQPVIPEDFQDETSLDGCDVLIVPNGDVRQIVEGIDAAPTYSSLPPWARPTKAKGIGDRGLQLIRRFVKRGGRYVGFELGGGALAGRRYLGLVDAEIEPDRELSPAPVRLEVQAPENPLFNGYSKEVDAKGPGENLKIWTYLNAIPAWYFQPGDISGGRAAIFRVGERVRVLAYTADSHHPAVFLADRKEGEVLVFAVTTFFRGIWKSTAMLLANAILTPRGYLQDNHAED